MLFKLAPTNQHLVKYPSPLTYSNRLHLPNRVHKSTTHSGFDAQDSFLHPPPQQGNLPSSNFSRSMFQNGAVSWKPTSIVAHTRRFRGEKVITAAHWWFRALHGNASVLPEHEYIKHEYIKHE